MVLLGSISVFLALTTTFMVYGVSSAAEASAAYGMDVSYPHQSLSGFLDSDNENSPLGNDARERYKTFMNGCREYYADISHWCDDNEVGRIELNKNQPKDSTNYTQVGFKKVKAPSYVIEPLQKFFNDNYGKEIQEDWPKANTYVNHWTSPSYMLHLTDTKLIGGGNKLRQSVWDYVKSTIEEWTNQRQKPTSLYGIRIYKTGSILSPHVDRPPLISSAIINVAQDVDEPWVLELINRDGTATNVTMDAGDMVLYESHSIIHGRPFPLKGRYFANCFVHFAPLGKLDSDEDIDDHGVKDWDATVQDQETLGKNDGGVRDEL